LLRRKTASAVSISERNQLISTHVTLPAEIAGGLMPKLEFDLLIEAANQAHEKCIEAREHFFKHREEHGC
jgi:hypothetical protein